MLATTISRTRTIILEGMLTAAIGSCHNIVAQELSYGNFRELCRQGMRNKTMPLLEVHVLVTSTVVGSNIGIVFNPPLTLKPEHHITILRETQVGIESLRGFADQSLRRRIFWGPEITKSETIVADALHKLQQPSMDNAAKLKLARDAQQAVIAQLTGALNSYAKQTGRTVATAAPASPEIHFTATTKPPERGVQLLLLGDYILWQSGTLDTQAKTIDESTLWAELNMPEAVAYGIFYYRLVETHDGVKRATPFDRLRRKDIIQEPSTGMIVFD